MSALASDVDVSALVLQVVGAKLSTGTRRVDTRLTDGTLSRTMTGASSLTFVLDDSDRTLLRSGLFDQQIDVEFDGLWWRLVQVSKATDTLTLTFEDRVVSLLRQITTPRKASRSKMTRAEFALSIVREVTTGGPVPFICPDLHVKQKVAIETSSDALTPTTRKANVGPGLATGAKGLTVKGAPATAEQKSNAERVLDVANSLGASERATLALLEAVIVESGIVNLTYGDRDSLGILQVRESTGPNMTPPVDPMNIEQCCNAFLTRGFFTDSLGGGGAILIAAKHPEATTGQIAQGCQGSGVPGAYDKYKTEAAKWLAAYTGTGIGAGTVPTNATQQPYQFMRGEPDGPKGEDSWACLQRLAQDVQWDCFAADGAIYFVAETTLIAGKPSATLDEQTLGVEGIDFDVDNGKTTSDATLTLRASRLAFPPGSVIVLDNCGPANGRWLVDTVERSLFDTLATLTLKRATQPLPEPANTSGTSSTSLDGTDPATGLDLSGLDAGGLVANAYAAAKAIDAKRYPYVWGGGHAHCGTPDGGTGRDPGIGYDCSGSTCAVLAAANMGYTLGGPADVSGTMAASWGEPGEGQHLTVWANSIHVWMEFKTSKGDQHFGTGDWGSDTGTGGPAFQSRMHTKDGFTPRHWKGT